MMPKHEILIGLEPALSSSRGRKKPQLNNIAYKYKGPLTSGGLVVNVLAFYSDDPSSNHAFSVY